VPRKKVNERRKREGDIYRLESDAGESFKEFQKRQKALKKKVGGHFMTGTL